MINELLRKRILGLTGDAATLPPESMQQQIQANGGVFSNKDMEIIAGLTPRLVDGSPLPEGMVPGIRKTMEFRDVNQNGIEDRSEGIYMQRDLVPASSLPTMTPAQREYQDRFFVGPDDGLTNMDPGFGMSFDKMTPEDQQNLQELLNRAEQVSAAPLGQIAQELAMQGEGDDTQLAHLRAGEVVLPPEFFEDEQFESAVEKKFKQAGINPEQAVVGTGVASLNSVTGLEQFGFFKKLGKKLKKVVKKVAPIAAFIPGVGTALGGVLGGVAGKVGGALGLKGTVAKSVLGGIGGLKIPGISSIAGGAAGGFGSLQGLGSLSGMLKGGPFGGLVNQQQTPTNDVIGTLNGQPITKADYANLTTEQIMQIKPLAPSTQQQSGGNLISRLIGGDQSQGEGFFSGGLGDALKLGGIGALASGLGKLAYEDAQKQKGVPLTPLTTMSPTGRYNIEAEIARRMGQEAPNPVEFGLLPAGTIPELSGGKPVGMQEGGSVETTQEVIEEAMEIVQLAEQEPALKETPEYQEALNILQRQMLTAAVMGKGDTMGGMKPFKNPLVGPASGVTSAISHLANQTLKRRMGRGLKAAQEKAQGIGAFGPNLPIEKMYGGPVMTYAEGGAVQMQTGGEMDPSQFPRMDGDINGPGTETSDDIPAMLSDGEFVMTGRAVRGAGSYEMQADPNGIISLMPTLEEDRERGMDNMYKMMDVFASKAEAS